MAQAEALALHALRIHEQHLGPLHPSTADELHTLALLYRDQGKPAEAEPLFLRALSIREQAFVSTHLSLADTLYELALLQHVQGHNDEARLLYERALAARIHILGAAHPLTVDTREHLIDLLRSMGSTEDAAQLERVHQRATDLLSEGTPVSSMRKAMEQSAAVAGTGDSVLPACPGCQQTTAVLKSGKNRSGSQRFRCRACRLYFTPQPSIWKPDQARTAEALALAEQGLSYRRIASLLGVHHLTVIEGISTHDAHSRE